MRKIKNPSKDLTGQIFGFLTVLHFDNYYFNKNKTKREGYFKCKCECGEIISAKGETLRNGNIKSCGDKKHWKKEIPDNDLTGQKIGKLSIISFHGFLDISDKGRKSKTKSIAHYNCLCDCGKEKIISGNNLRIVKSCGCLKEEVYKNKINNGIINSNSETIEEALLKRYYKDYERGAKRRNLIFNLSLKDFAYFCYQNCEYCGIEPLPLSKCYAKNRSNLSANGIDRIDNTKGYDFDNCITCCKYCNFSKFKFSLDEWMNWLDRIANFRKNKNESKNFEE